MQEQTVNEIANNPKKINDLLKFKQNAFTCASFENILVHPVFDILISF